VLTGTAKGMAETFGSTCHGAGRARSRNSSRRQLDYQQVPGAVLHGVSCRAWWAVGLGLSCGVCCALVNKLASSCRATWCGVLRAQKASASLRASDTHF